MSAISKALANADRSYVAAKASVASMANEMLATSRGGLPVRRASMGDAAEQLLVEQEVLPERLRRAEPVRGDDLAQRGEGQAAARRAAISPAMRIAAIIAPGSARRLPAMPNAVP